MRSKIAPLLLLAGLLNLPAAGAPPRMANLIPDDSVGVLLFDDVPRFLATWPESPLGQLWEDPQMKRFLAPMRAEMEVDRWQEMARDATGFTLSEILAGFTGQAAVIVREFPEEQGAEEAGESEPTLAVIAQVGSDLEPFRKLMALDLDDTREDLKEGEELREVEEEFEGTTLHLRQIVTAGNTVGKDGWAILDGIAVMAQPHAFLEELVAGVRRGEVASPLSRTAGFSKVRRRVPQADPLLYVNFGPIYERLVHELSQGAEEPETGDDDATGSAVDPRAMFEAFGFDALQAAFVSMSHAGGVSTLDAGVLFDEDRGLVRLIAYGPGPVSLPAFIAADALTATAANFSLPQAWTTLREILDRANPGIALMITMTLQQLSSDSGVDLEKSVFGSLGDRMYSAGFLRAPERPGEKPSLEGYDEVAVLEVTDRQTLEIALGAILQLVGQGSEMFDTREFLGTTIHVSKQPLPRPEGAPEARAAWALTDTHLMFSTTSAAPIESVLSRMAQPGGKSLWERKDVKKALRHLPESASAVSYVDVPTLLGTIFQAMATIATASEMDWEESIDLESLPDPAELARYFGVGIGYVYKTGEAFGGEMKILPPDED